MDANQILTLLWGAVTALAGIIYKMQLDQLKQKDERIDELEAELKANNQQLAQNTEALNKVLLMTREKSSP